jgi:hypothetical protein
MAVSKEIEAMPEYSAAYNDGLRALKGREFSVYSAEVNNGALSITFETFKDGAPYYVVAAKRIGGHA